MLHAGMKEKACTSKKKIQAFSRVTFSQLTTCVSRGRICKSLSRRGRHGTAGVMALFTAHLVPWFHPARRPLLASLTQTLKKYRRTLAG